MALGGVSGISSRARRTAAAHSSNRSPYRYRSRRCSQIPRFTASVDAGEVIDGGAIEGDGPLDVAGVLRRNGGLEQQRHVIGPGQGGRFVD